MKKLSKKEWVGVAIGLFVIAIVFYSNTFISFLWSPVAPMTENSGTAAAENFNQQTNQQPNMEQNAPAPKPTPGIFVVNNVVGKGTEAVNGSNVSINYTGKFQNGTKFDSSYDRGVPLDFQIGAGQLIPGFDRGVIGMKVGGKRTITIPPELAYGANGYPPVIPPNSTLVFEIELLSVK